ncbi:hypothetical protein J4N45_10275 [Vibrio sp. SCSIO 43140]|uniref:hypothetical protein n=1 Tax=Vibrio sp. SCSIO 43140 TaxID=2819100 RepID=UPI00207628C1|nr:hypothetical protein [Vibrio sp. SCSIO 43140]USD58915.1 hypothetical protein J4N45_10275 [Vibrio sp. SCSIO 43140]
MKYFKGLLLMMVGTNAYSGELYGDSLIPVFGEPSSFSEVLGVELAKEDALKPVTRKYTMSDNIDVTYAHRPIVEQTKILQQRLEECGEHVCLVTKVRVDVSDDVSEDIRSRMRDLDTDSLTDIVGQQTAALSAMKQKYRINSISKNINQALLNRWISFSADEELDLLERIENKEHFDGFNVDPQRLDVYRIDDDLIEVETGKDQYAVYRVTNPRFEPTFVNLMMEQRYRQFKDELRFNHHYSQTTFSNPYTKQETIIWRGRYDCLSYKNVAQLMAHQSASNVTMLHTQPEVDLVVNGQRISIGRGYYDDSMHSNQFNNTLGVHGNQYPNAFCQFVHGELILRSANGERSTVNLEAKLNYRVKMFDLPSTFRAESEALAHWVPVRAAYNQEYYQPKFTREAVDYSERCAGRNCSSLYFNDDVLNKIFNVSPRIKLPVDGRRGLFPMRIETFSPSKAREVSSSRPWFIEDCTSDDCGFEKGVE